MAWYASEPLSYLLHSSPSAQSPGSARCLATMAIDCVPRFSSLPDPRPIRVRMSITWQPALQGASCSESSSTRRGSAPVLVQGPLRKRARHSLAHVQVAAAWGPPLVRTRPPQRTGPAAASSAAPAGACCLGPLCRCGGRGWPAARGVLWPGLTAGGPGQGEREAAVKGLCGAQEELVTSVSTGTRQARTHAHTRTCTCADTHAVTQHARIRTLMHNPSAAQAPFVSVLMRGRCAGGQHARPEHAFWARQAEHQRPHRRRRRRQDPPALQGTLCAGYAIACVARGWPCSLRLQWRRTSWLLKSVARTLKKLRVIRTCEA